MVRAFVVLLLLTFLFVPVQCLAFCGKTISHEPPCHQHGNNGRSHLPADCLQQHVTEGVGVETGHVSLLPAVTAGVTTALPFQLLVTTVVTQGATDFHLFVPSPHPPLRI